MARTSPAAKALGVAKRDSLLKQRRLVGRLSLRLVKPRTLAYYNKACAWFFTLLQVWKASIGSDFWELDEVICDVTEFAWETGENRGLIGNLLSGLEHHCPFLRGNLKCAWRLWRVWGNSEIPCRAPPLTAEAVMGMAAYMWEWKFYGAAVLTCLAFHGFLRSMEFLSVQCKQFAFSADGTRCHLTLPRTKGASRSGNTEGLSIDDKLLVQLLSWLLKKAMPGDFVLGMTAANYRLVFRAAARAIGLPDTFQPYSLRRGGATWHFRQFGSMSSTMERGRWKSMTTARTYVNTALMELTEMSYLDSPLVMDACGHFTAILARFAE